MEDFLKDIDRVLVSKQELQAKVKELGAQITKDYSGMHPLFIGVLKGCVVFFSDLIREIKLDCQIDFMVVSSYGAGTTTSGEVKVIKDVNTPLENRHVIIVEDIVDSGKTLSHLVRYLAERGASSVKTCTLLDKPSRRTVEFVPDYCGKEIPDKFVIGFGLDYDEKYRNLPFVGVLKPEVYGG